MKAFTSNLIRKAFPILCCAQLAHQSTLAQDSLENKGVHLNLYLEPYYSYDLSKPNNHEKPSFFYSHNRHNEFNVNLALLNFTYKDSTKKLNIGIMAGTYPLYNLASEPGVLKHIYEANAGVKISSKKDLWVEAGVFPSHIGFESAVSHDCWTLTRSIMAENSPYYETGIKLSSRSRNGKWYWAAMALNGWQKISRTDGNNGPAFGTQLTFRPGKKFSVNSSTYIGTEQPDSARQWRYFHNLYALWQISDEWGLILAFDVGIQQKAKHTNVFNAWYTPLAIARYQHKNWAFAGRLEYYQDKKGVIVPVVNSTFLGVFGLSLNAHRRIFENILWRMEGRWLNSDPPYFRHRAGFRANHFSITSSLSVLLQK